MWISRSGHTPATPCHQIPQPYFPVPLCCHFNLILMPRLFQSILTGFPIQQSYCARCDGLMSHDYAVK
jgi:hypothetical protein